MNSNDLPILVLAGLSSKNDSLVITGFVAALLVLHSKQEETIQVGFPQPWLLARQSLSGYFAWEKSTPGNDALHQVTHSSEKILNFRI